MYLCQSDTLPGKNAPFLSYNLTHSFVRTRVSDPAFTENLSRIAEIPEKAFAASVVANITDVSSMIHFDWTGLAGRCYICICKLQSSSK